MVDWFKREFGAARGRPGRRARHRAPRRCSTSSSAATAPGSMGLMLQPTWSPGVRIPGPEAKGAIIGFGDVHTRAHLYRAILEGLAYALREGGERAAARAKVPLRELRVSGGGAQSPAAVQLTADIFGLPTGAAPHPRDGGPGCGDRRRGRPGPAAELRDGGRRDDAGASRRATRTPSGTGSTRSSTGASTCRCTAS